MTRPNRGGGWGGGAEAALTPRELEAARRFVARVRHEVPAVLVQASLFGSKARGEARPGSDVDVLLVFERLAWDREPHASHAEEIAEEVARRTGVPVTTWCVSLVDLEHGSRTPMLVDALHDSIPLWCRGEPLPRLPFTPADALRCVDALLRRTAEGSEEFARHLARGEARAATRRARDDLVRMCTAALLLRGETRPRRGDAVRAFVRRELAGIGVPRPAWAVLAWAARSYGPDGKAEWPAGPAPGGPRAVAAVVDALRRGVCRRAARLADRVDGAGGAEPGVAVGIQRERDLLPLPLRSRRRLRRSPVPLRLP